MKLTKQQCEDLKDGTILRVVRTGEEWEKEWLQTEKVIKFGENLYILKGFFLTEDIEADDGYEIEVYYSSQDNLSYNLPQRLF